MPPRLTNVELRMEWKCVQEGTGEVGIVSEVVFPQSGPLHWYELTSAIHYAHP